MILSTLAITIFGFVADPGDDIDYQIWQIKTQNKSESYFANSSLANTKPDERSVIQLLSELRPGEAHIQNDQPTISLQQHRRSSTGD